MAGYFPKTQRAQWDRYVDHVRSHVSVYVFARACAEM